MSKPNVGRPIIEFVGMLIPVFSHLILFVMVVEFDEEDPNLERVSEEVNDFVNFSSL